MKNFQQTPKQRRVKLAQAKTALQNSRNKGFQPRIAWTGEKKLGGVFVETLIEKQYAAGHAGVHPSNWYVHIPFMKPPREFRI